MSLPILIDTFDLAINITIDLSGYIHKYICTLFYDFAPDNNPPCSLINQAVRIKLYYSKQYGKLFSNIFSKGASIYNYYWLKYVDDNKLHAFLDLAIREVIADKLALYIILNDLPISPAAAILGNTTCSGLIPFSDLGYYNYEVSNSTDVCILKIIADNNKLYVSLDSEPVIFYIISYDLSNNNYCYFNIVDVSFTTTSVIIKFEVLNILYFVNISYIEFIKLYSENINHVR